MIVLFEGVDGSGKTTLINKMSNYLISHNKDVITLHLSKPSNNINNIYKSLLSYLAEYKVNKNSNSLKQDTFIFLDRAIISNLIYGAIYNNQTIIANDNAWNFICNCIDKIVLCHIDNKEYWQNLFIKDKNSGKDEMYSFDNDLARVYDFYNLLVNKDFDKLKKLINQQNLDSEKKYKLTYIVELLEINKNKIDCQLNLYNKPNFTYPSFIDEYI